MRKFILLLLELNLMIFGSINLKELLINLYSEKYYRIEKNK